MHITHIIWHANKYTTFCTSIGPYFKHRDGVLSMAQQLLPTLVHLEWKVSWNLLM